MTHITLFLVQQKLLQYLFLMEIYVTTSIKHLSCRGNFGDTEEVMISRKYCRGNFGDTGEVMISRKSIEEGRTIQ